MIAEDYVSFEIAKLLKEKGFDANLLVCYTPDGLFARSYGIKTYTNESEDSAVECICPTLQMVMKWLRKVHEIFIRPNISFLYSIRYYCEIFCYGDNLKTQQDITTENFESPEEACEAAIKYCLENLI